MIKLTGQDVSVSLCHLKKRSVLAKKGDRVRAGDQFDGLGESEFIEVI